MRPRLAILARTLGGTALAAAFALPARAQDAAVAEELYRDGQKLIAAGKTHEACLKFADSERADPELGTLVALAACHEREGKVASAWSEFTEAADLASRHHDPTRARYARQHAAALDPHVHRIRIDVAPPATEVSVQLAGQTYGPGTLGSAIPLDPGDYEIEVHAPGKKPFSRALHVDPKLGGEERIQVLLEDAPPEPPQEARAAPVPLHTSESGPERSSGTRTAGFVVGGIGLALGVGAVLFEAHAISLSNKADDDARAANAAGSDSAYRAAASEHDDAVASQRFAILTGVGGVVAIGVGAVLVLRRSTHRTAGQLHLAPTASRGGAGLSLGGCW